MKQLLIYSLLLLGISSCRKFLEEQSQTDFTPQTVSDYQELLFGEGYPRNGDILLSQLILMDDDLQAYNYGDQTASINPNKPAFTWQRDYIDDCRSKGSLNAEQFNSWQSYYELILGCNTALQYSNIAKGTVKERNKLKGEAFTLRAYYHFMLVNLYAKPYNDAGSPPEKNIGIPLKIDANLADNYPVRNTVKEVYQQIVSDLDSAFYYLDADKVSSKGYRVGHVAAHFLASRVYLYMENWDQVIRHSDYVLQYHPQLKNLEGWGEFQEGRFIMDAKNNIELIFSFGDLRESFPDGKPAGYDVSADLARTFESTDLRNIVYFKITPDWLLAFIPMEYSSLKFGINGTDISNPYAGIHWRSAEMYLNRAEARLRKYQKGDQTAGAAGLHDLNTLRRHRFNHADFVEWTLEPADEMLKKCREERRRELFQEEGHRWFDLRRYGMPAIRHIFAENATTRSVYELSAGDPQYTLPIPNEILGRNPALTQNKQIDFRRSPL